MTRALLLLLLLPACGTLTGRSASNDLADLVDAEWRRRLEASPLLATSVGSRVGLDRMPSVTPADLARRADADRADLEALGHIDAAALDDEDRVTLAMIRRELADRIADFEFGEWQMPLTSDSGFHTALVRLPREVPLQTLDDYEAYLARLRDLPRYVDEQLENMRAGLREGRTLARVVLDGIESTIAAEVVDDPEESAFFAPFAAIPDTIPPARRDRLRAAGRVTVAAKAVPAMRSIVRFFADEYRPGARPTIGASEWPDGAAHYAHLVRRFTTLDATPEEIHRTGLDEVARIRAEMTEVIARTGFDGDYAAFLGFLRTDPRFYAETPEELLRRAAWICKKMEGALPRLIGHLPRRPFTVAPVPAAIAPKYTGGRYVPAPAGSDQPGTYWVNTYALESRPLYVLPALSLHEAVPGHHTQIALGQEMEGLPEFRRHTYINAYGEGWALYGERLGLEAGIYADPYDDFGRLTYEMWRACRLVVDTGMHAFGWSRERARAYLAENTALSLHEVGTEIDRYISWPGQALSYKAGELEIRRLRAEAEAALGAGFDRRAFHDELLAHGPVPLDVLRENVERWVARTSGR